MTVFALVILTFPSVLAVGGCTGDFTPSCADTNTLDCRLEMTSGSTTTTHNYTIQCPEGCVNSSFEGTSFCREPPKPIDMNFIIILEIAAICMLLFSMIRKKDANRAEYTYQVGFMSLVAMILFFVIAFTTTMIVVVYVNWMFGAVAFIWTVYLYAMSMYPDDKKENANPLGV